MASIDLKDACLSVLVWEALCGNTPRVSNPTDEPHPLIVTGQLQLASWNYQVYTDCRENIYWPLDATQRHKCCLPEQVGMWITS